MEPIAILPLGGCQLSVGLRALGAEGKAIVTTDRIGLNPDTYGVAEMLQRVRFCRGEVEIPKWLRYYCNLPDDLDPVAADARRIERADIALIEPNNPVDILFGPYALYQASLYAGFLNTLRTASDELDAAIDAWLAQGIFGCDRAAQREAANVILPAVAGRVQDEYVVRKLLLEARGHKRNAEQYLAGIEELRDLLDVPAALVPFVYEFLPDGRPICWPPDFLDDTLAAGRSLGLPVFNPVALVKKHGVATALTDDRRLYREEFRAVVGEAYLEFCRTVLSEKTPKNAKSELSPATRANLLADQRPFASSGWRKNCSFVANNAWMKVRSFLGDDANLTAIETAPRGLLPVKLIEEEPPSNTLEKKSHDVRRDFAGAPMAGEYTFSFFARPAERKTLWLYLGKAGLADRAEAYFDLRSGFAGGVCTRGLGVSNAHAGIWPMAGNWWWCWLTARCEPADGMEVLLSLADRLGEMYYVGDGRSGAWIGGPRLERGMRPILDLNEE